MSIQRRLKGPTPVFFKKLRKWIISLASGLAGLGVAIIAIPGMVAGATGKAAEFPLLSQIGVYCIVIGGVCAALGAFLTSLPLEINQETKEEAKDEIKEEISKSLDGK